MYSKKKELTIAYFILLILFYMHTYIHMYMCVRTYVHMYVCKQFILIEYYFCFPFSNSIFRSISFMYVYLCLLQPHCSTFLRNRMPFLTAYELPSLPVVVLLLLLPPRLLSQQQQQPNHNKKIIKQVLLLNFLIQIQEEVK